MSTPRLPPPFNTSPPDSLTLIAQGAEALLYRTTWWDDHDPLSDEAQPVPVALKIRPRKPWRHPSLDRRLTRARILAEARVLVKCRRDRVPVPAVYALDCDAGWCVVEWIAGPTVKAAIRGRRSKEEGREINQQGRKGEGEGMGSDSRVGEEEVEEKEEESEGSGESEESEKDKEELRNLLRRIGGAVGKLHAAGVIHGDLTTSNMLLRPNRDNGRGEGEEEGGLGGEIVLIDFGLAVHAVQEEERAVDLYVLERAFGSTHPREESEFGEVLKAYEGCYKGAKATLRRLEDVRMRGRKKSMIG